VQLTCFAAEFFISLSQKWSPIGLLKLLKDYKASISNHISRRDIDFRERYTGMIHKPNAFFALLLCLKFMPAVHVTDILLVKMINTNKHVFFGL
jgi:hypothetical protein